ncbi:uncharacterized protein LOC103937639 [Pyrus x bretschneideri]|nr:uncharacterized protein LOC103937639 [Pyrus x bretschneideri]
MRLHFEVPHTRPTQYRDAPPCKFTSGRKNVLTNFSRSLSFSRSLVPSFQKLAISFSRFLQGLWRKLGCGQVEELIEEARDELTLIGKMIEWDPWGVPDDYECEVIENDAPVPKHVPLHRPGPLSEEFYKTLEGLTTNQPKLDEAKVTSIGSEAKE